MSTVLCNEETGHIEMLIVVLCDRIWEEGPYGHTLRNMRQNLFVIVLTVLIMAV